MTLWVFYLFYFEIFLSFFLEQNNRIFQTLSEVAGSADPTLTQESVRAMGLDPHGDRLFLLHLLEIYGYDTLMVSEQLCCSWGTTEVLSFSSAAPLASQTVRARWCISGTISLTCIFTLLLHLVAVAPLLHSVIRCKKTWCRSRNSRVGRSSGYFEIFESNGWQVRSREEKVPKLENSNKVCTNERRKREGIWWFTGEDWRCGNAHERHPTCEQNPAFILLLCCRILRVWIGLRLSADVAFLVSSAGFKHLYFLYLFLVYFFF